MDGGSRVAQVFKNHGVSFVFTLVGGHISPILVASKALGMRVIDVRHEVNAVFAADAVARLTGVPGVAVVTAGPGVTNTITAIKNAQMAQSPLVLIGGAPPTLLRGRGALQDIDQLAVIKPIVKWSARPSRLADVIPAIEEAFRIAQEGVPGPVFVELAIDLLYSEEQVRSEFTKKLEKENMSLTEQATALAIRAHFKWVYSFSADPQFDHPTTAIPRGPTGGDLDQAIKTLKGAKRPLVVLGSQATLRATEITKLRDAIKSLGIPVYLSGMARGLLGKDHPLHMRHKRRNALREADVVVLCGVPADFRLDYGSHLSQCSVIGVNLSKEDVNKNRRPELGIRCDPHTFLLQLADRLGKGASFVDWTARLQGRDDERNAEIDEMAKAETEHQNPLALCQTVDEILADDSILIGDGGDFVATVAYTVQPRGPLCWLDPGVFGTLGVGAGFALGAKLVRPDADLWLMYGDGASGFSLMEMDTFARHGVGVIALIGNDAGWTQIERDQVVILKDDVACRLTFMDYHIVGKACGGEGLLLKDASRAKSVLKKAVKLSREGKPVVVNAWIGKTDFRKGSLST
ncbi:MAG: thiamine pyrophosphate-binding protein [Rhodobacterales bacterium]|nr:thiamine pyrophosphate-binding protein [Rhodobacterales bacterium]